MRYKAVAALSVGAALTAYGSLAVWLTGKFFSEDFVHSLSLDCTRWLSGGVALAALAVAFTLLIANPDHRPGPFLKVLIATSLVAMVLAIVAMLHVKGAIDFDYFDLYIQPEHLHGRPEIARTLAPIALLVGLGLIASTTSVVLASHRK
jgi:hypothetical protein